MTGPIQEMVLYMEHFHLLEDITLVVYCVIKPESIKQFYQVLVIPVTWINTMRQQIQYIEQQVFQLIANYVIQQRVGHHLITVPIFQ